MSCTAEEQVYEVLWHHSYDGYERTTIEAPDKPSPAEAAQVIAVMEDEDLMGITVDSIKEARS